MSVYTHRQTEMLPKGSHVRMKHEDGRVVTIPIHSGKTLGKGLLLKILRDADLTKEQLIDLLA